MFLLLTCIKEVIFLSLLSNSSQERSKYSKNGNDATIEYLLNIYCKHWILVSCLKSDWM